MSELIAVKGAKFINLVSEITAAVAASSAQRDAATAFIKSLATPDVVRVIQAKGMEPG